MHMTNENTQKKHSVLLCFLLLFLPSFTLAIQVHKFIQLLKELASFCWGLKSTETSQDYQGEDQPCQTQIKNKNPQVLGTDEKNMISSERGKWQSKLPLVYCTSFELQALLMLVSCALLHSGLTWAEHPTALFCIQVIKNACGCSFCRCFYKFCNVSLRSELTSDLENR